MRDLHTFRLTRGARCVYYICEMIRMDPGALAAQMSRARYSREVIEAYDMAMHSAHLVMILFVGDDESRPRCGEYLRAARQRMRWIEG